MDNNVLNDILESAFHNVINDPHIMNDFNSSMNTSNSNSNSNSNAEENMNDNNVEDTRQTDMNNDTYNIHVNDYSVLREYQSFLGNYNDNMRLYSHNMGQMNRCISNLLMNSNLQPVRSIPQTTSRNRPFRTPAVNVNAGLGSLFPNTHIRFLTPNRDNTTIHTVPTMQQVLTQTKFIVFNENEADQISSNQCAITQHDFVQGEIVAELNHCKHVFKMESLLTWFSRNSHCPVCRYNISS
jgi:hypothetical protein